jgi:hypothetical protein
MAQKSQKKPTADKPAQKPTTGSTPTTDKGKQKPTKK